MYLYYKKRSTVRCAHHVTSECWPHTNSIPFTFTFTQATAVEAVAADAVAAAVADATPGPGSATYCSHNTHTPQNLMQPY